MYGIKLDKFLDGICFIPRRLRKDWVMWVRVLYRRSSSQCS